MFIINNTLDVLAPVAWAVECESTPEGAKHRSFWFHHTQAEHAKVLHQLLKDGGFDTSRYVASTRIKNLDVRGWKVTSSRQPIPVEVMAEATKVMLWPAPSGMPVDARSPAKVAEDALAARLDAELHPGRERRARLERRIAKTQERLAVGRQTGADKRAAEWLQGWMTTTRASTNQILNDRATSGEYDDGNERLVAEILAMRAPKAWSVPLARECARLLHPKRFIGSQLVLNQNSLYTEVITFWSPKKGEDVRGAALILEQPGSESRYDMANPRIWMGWIDDEAAEVLAPAMPGVAAGKILVMPFLASRERNGFIQDADERDQWRDLLPLYLVLDDEFAAVVWKDAIDELQFEARRAREMAARHLDEAEPDEFEVADARDDHDPDFGGWDDPTADDLPEWFTQLTKIREA